MAVKLRLRREGTRKKNHFRVVAADTRAPRDGRFLEIIGEYHPMDNPSGIRLDPERALHWLRNGARPTDTVQQLLYLSGIWEQFRPGTTPDDIEINESLARPAGVPAPDEDGGGEAEEGDEADGAEAGADEADEAGAGETDETGQVGATGEDTAEDDATGDAPEPAAEQDEHTAGEAGSGGDGDATDADAAADGAAEATADDDTDQDDTEESA